MDSSGPFLTRSMECKSWKKSKHRKKSGNFFFHFLLDFLSKRYFPQNITLSGPDFGFLLENLETVHNGPKWFITVNMDLMIRNSP